MNKKLPGPFVLLWPASQAARPSRKRQVPGARASAIFASPLLAAALLPTSVASAQTTPVAENAATTTGSRLEDIVVVAQRRAESLQKVPIAITAITSDALKTQGIESTDDLGTVTPGLAVTAVRSAVQFYLRGVGAQFTGAGGEGSVATYVDGVYYSSLTASVFGFNNIERVEVLKGPQGTLFGRNATGGLVHVITRDPSFTPSLEGSVGYGNYQTVTASAYATGGLSEKVAMDASLYYLRQFEGFGRNVFLNREVNRDRKFGARSKLLFTPGDKTRIILSGDYFYNGSDIGNTRNIYPGSISVGGYPALPGKRDTRSDLGPNAISKQYGFAGKLEQDLSDTVKLTSLSAYRRLRNTSGFDQDTTPITFANAFFVDLTKTFQQEVLLVGNTDRFDWTTGLFYFHASASLDFLNRSATSAASNFNRFSTQTTNSYAAFAQGTYEVIDGTRLTAGLRYTIDKRKIVGQDLTMAGVVSNSTAIAAALPITSPNHLDPNRRFKKLTWRFGIDQEIGSDAMVYATVSRGFKSGGFNGSNPYQQAVNPETLDAYEIGVKSELFDHVLRLNASAFLYKYKDIQLTSNLSGISYILNAGRGTIKGFEVDATLAPRLPQGSLTLNADLSVLGTKYDRFLGAPSQLPKGLPGTCVLNSGNPACGGNTLVFINASGNEMIRAPNWTLNVTANYEHEMSWGGKLGLNVSWFHSDGFFWEADNRVKQEAYDVVNTQLSLSTAEDRWRLRLYVHNVFNKDYLTQFSASTLAYGVSYAAPRTYGFAIDFKF